MYKNFPAEFEQGKTLPLFKFAYCVNKCIFCSLFSTTFKKCVFLFSRLVTMPFNMAPSVALKCRLVFPSARKLWSTLWRKCVCLMGFIQAWVIVLWAINSMLMNQKYQEKRKLAGCTWNHFATSTTCYEAKKMTEMGLNLWIHGLAISFLKSVVEVLFPVF